MQCYAIAFMAKPGRLLRTCGRPPAPCSEVRVVSEAGPRLMYLYERSSPAACDRPPSPPHSFRAYRAVHRSVPEARFHAHSVITG
jgi:hypothetical protein